MSDCGDHVLNAIYDVAQSYPGGARALARKIGVQPGTFSNKCNPNMHGHVLNINEVRSVMRNAGGGRILDELARENKCVCVPIQDYDGVSDMELLDAWAAWEGERAETVLAIKGALLDRKITNHELEYIHKEMFQDFKVELALLERLKSISE